jgi:hypothetical protein
VFKQPVFLFLVAIVSIAASSIADARPRHRAPHRAIHASIVCNQQGCSDRAAVRHVARAGKLSSFGKVRQAHRHRTAHSHVAAARPSGPHHAKRFETKQRVTLRRTTRHIATNEARLERRERRRAEPTIIVCDLHGCSDRVIPGQSVSARAESPRAHRASNFSDANGNAVVVVGGRPAGCPHRFCGCEASRYVFGEIRPELNLAANWIRKFSRTQPAPGMAAARSGHVMILISHAGGNDWLVHDGNSGGGLTRDHVMSIGRYVIVDPRSSRSAQR